MAATFPLLISLILVGIIANRRLNAITWSVVGKALHETSFPVLLRSDTVQTKYVYRPVVAITTVTTAVAYLLLAAHFLTPLPLTSVVQPDQDAATANFSFVPDPSFFGQATTPRAPQPLSRRCLQNNPKCPDPSVALDIFSASVEGTTIAGPRDIQYRNYLYIDEKPQPNSDRRAVGYMRPVQQILLEGSIRVVDGLVVDAVNGGVGLRNHTAPTNLGLGATWEEDILWIQPETVCEPTNFTLHWAHYPKNTSYLQDDGAFAERGWTVPDPRWDIYNTSSVWNVSRGLVPDLQQQAWLASWWNNYFTAKELGIGPASTLAVGNRYTGKFSTYTSFISPYAISISWMDGSYFDASWPANLNYFAQLFIDRLGIPVSQFVQGANESKAFQRQFTAYGTSPAT